MTNAEPDGVEEMTARRQQRKARRQGRNPRTLPEPRHPRPPANTGPADETSTDGSAGTGDEPGGQAPTSEHEAERSTGPAKAGGQAGPEHADGTDRGTAEPDRREAEQPAAASEPAVGHPVTGQDVSVPPAAAGVAKTASDAALSWAAAARKQQSRLDGLAAAVSRARADGVPLLVLTAALADAEHRAGTSLPPEVWAAAEA